MKEIIAIIRTDHVEPTKGALESIDVKGITFSNVIGRGRQRGTIRVPDPESTVRKDVGVYIMQQRGIISDADDPKYHVPVQKEIELGFLPKKMLMIVVNDDEVPHIVDTLTQINRSGQQGDGKIFVCPMTDAVRIRTGERGNKALS
ncbi:MAG: P-II family nitrogen regulator [Methanoregula sp.]|jgi:nitrogen regulatory protein PII 2|uniref:P-II family nitrogen regulator n=1 Tax=Methanoregula sp. TaxID=2052170 RepID=UPI003C17C61B